MQFQRQESKQPTEYFIRIERGEELITTLLEFCKKEGITGGSITGIGGTSDVTLGYLPKDTKDYQKKRFHGKGFEVLSLNGNASADRLHIHAIISDESYSSFGGHVFELTAFPGLEIKITPFDTLERAHDEASGLMLLDLKEKHEI